MKGKIRTALAALLVLALMTGCVFTPPTAGTPRITLKSSEIGATDPIEFTIDNYNSSFLYKFYVNGKAVEAEKYGTVFKIAPSGRWDLVNKLTVTVTDSYGNMKSTSADFLAEAKDTVKYQITDGKVILKAQLDKTTEAAGKPLIWRVKFIGESNWKILETAPGASAMFEIPPASGPELGFEVSYDKGGNQRKVIVEGIVELPVRITITDIYNHGATSAEPEAEYHVSIEARISPDYAGYEWYAMVNGQPAKGNMSDHANGKYTIELYVPKEVINNGSNSVILKAKYRDITNRYREIESDRKTFF